MPLTSDTSGPQAPRSGLVIMQALILGLFCLFAFRLWYLQVHRGDYFTAKAQDNRLRREHIYAPRGLISDRFGTLMAVNEPAYALGLIREDTADIQATLEAVGSWTGVPVEKLTEVLESQKGRVKSFEPLILISDLPFSQVARIEANTLRWPGLEILIRARRHYPQGPLAAHVLGYVAEASEQELDADEELRPGDIVGKQGLEQALEKRLRGTKGLRQVEVDAVGRYLSEQLIRKPEAGENLTLSVDLKLQRMITRVLAKNDHAGAVVVMEPFTGQVLALVSTPSFDNNAFALGLSRKQWQGLVEHPRHPMQNRATQGVYPPGSVFKVFMAGAGLMEGLVDPEEEVTCKGVYRSGRQVFRCWRRWGHGDVDLERAIAESCDIYFYRLGVELGVDRIKAIAPRAGFGVPTGIDLPHEKAGLIPDRDWKLRRLSDPWRDGDTVNMSIGQGYTLVSPLQVARFTAALVNGGKLVKPLLVASDRPVVQSELPWSEDVTGLVMNGMYQVVVSDKGTAKWVRVRGVDVGGKTGTAQVIKQRAEYQNLETEEIPYRHRHHAWFTSWAHKDGRHLVVSVLVEHGGHGSESAAPVARSVIRWLFARPSRLWNAWPHIEPVPFDPQTLPRTLPQTLPEPSPAGLAAPRGSAGDGAPGGGQASPEETP